MLTRLLIQYLMIRPLVHTSSGARLLNKSPALLTPLLVIASTIAFTAAAPLSAGALTKDEACITFGSKLVAAQSSGDKAKAQEIYQKGSQRIAKKFNGATCPNVKAPTP